MQRWGEVWEEPTSVRMSSCGETSFRLCRVPDTPMQAVLRALDALDLDGAVALFARRRAR